MFLDKINQELDILKEKGNFRELRDIDSILSKPGMVNLSSNDYLSLGSDELLRREFLEYALENNLRLTSSSSRLLTGNTNEYIELENKLASLYGSEKAIVFGSGFHANEGILPAVSNEKTLILADKLSHASLIDGLRLSSAKNIRYRHNDYDQLNRLIAENSSLYEKIIIVTESIFSMDGDEVDLERLVEIKKSYNNILIYLDEAHGVGVRGKNGLGCAEEKGVIKDIDFLIGTFGKALASVGAYIICNNCVYEYLINKVRPFIFTTALPPINLAWSLFIMDRIASMDQRRERLKKISQKMHSYIESASQPVISSSHIIPVMIGESSKACSIAEQLQKLGFWVMAVRPPTVSEGKARLRISLCADMEEKQIDSLIRALKQLVPPYE
ncbi:MAG: 8-amino-7-oxononanoate synthase [Bacteroidales bacterium]|nr:8-amino-7-oxononanoate synthase [Bacteroidales bacterium]